MRLLYDEDIIDLATGGALLSGGGGGDTYASKLYTQDALRTYGPAQLISLDELDDDALVIGLCGMGAPTVGLEHLHAKDTLVNALRYLERHLGQAADALMTLEIGGSNALAPIPVAVRLGLPVVDIDAMGRALPELQMTSFSVHGLSASPMVLYGDEGNRTIIETIDNYWVEQFARSITTDMGARAAAALYPLRGRQVKQAAIPDSVSRAIEIGRTLRLARSQHQPMRLIEQILQAKRLFTGKVVDVHRQSDVGFARGQASIAGAGDSQGQTLSLQFQNEYLIAQIGQEVRASVPDIIGIFDQRTGDPIAVEALRYGSQVAVLVIPAPPIWRTPGGLALIGPRAFGYDIEYVPFVVTPPQSVL